MARKKSGGTFQATVIVDDSDMGGEVRMLIEGRTFIISGGLRKGLRDLADTSAHDAAFWSKTR